MRTQGSRTGRPGPVRRSARLAARGREDGRTLPALLQAAGYDDNWQVRDSVVGELLEFDTGAVLPVLRAAAHDVHEKVRWSARFAMFQKGFGPYPGPFEPREEGSPPWELFDHDLSNNQ